MDFRSWMRIQVRKVSFLLSDPASMLRLMQQLRWSWVEKSSSVQCWSRFCFVGTSNGSPNKWIIEDGATLETTRIIGLSFLDAGRIPELSIFFGFHGRQEACASVLRCVRLSDGKVMWTEPTTGSGNLIRVGEQMICLTETGELIVFEQNPIN